MRIFLLIFAMYLVGFFAHALYLKKTVYGDGAYYFSWLRSAVVEHSLPPSPNKYAIGPALLWSVPYVWAYTIIRGSGNELPYQLIVGATGVLYAFFGLILLFIALRKQFSQTASVITILAVAFATNLVFYGSLDTVNSHGVSFFASSLFLAFLFTRQAVLAGIALGFLGAIRHHDLILGVIAFGVLHKREWIRFFVGATIGFLPQLLAWQALYGNFLNIPYLTKEGFNFFQPHILDILFSTKNGLLIYSPILIIGFFGYRRSFTIALLVELIVISSWSTWSQGASYGIRMFVGSLPLASFGIANTFRQLMTKKILPEQALLVLVATLALLNSLLIVSFLL